jgi:DNA-binding NarL/FixJ family response regulator
MKIPAVGGCGYAIGTDGNTSKRPEMNEPPDFGLTDREYRVLSLIADGMDDQEIAGALAVSSFTVESDVQAIIRKLGAGSRTEAAVRALKSGLIR